MCNVLRIKLSGHCVETCIGELIQLWTASPCYASPHGSHQNISYWHQTEPGKCGYFIDASILYMLEMCLSYLHVFE